MHEDPDLQPPRPRLKLLGREFNLPRSRRSRVAIGGGLVVGGMLGFLPVLGFWMLPLGLIVLSYEFALIRRQRRRVTVWWGRRGTRSNGMRSKRAGRTSGGPDAAPATRAPCPDRHDDLPDHRHPRRPPAG